MTDIPAGSLTVKVDANLKPLTDGLAKAEQKVAQTDGKIQQTTENTKKGFFEAGGKVKDFQSKLSESLGVIAGFAAAAQLIGGLADGFTAARDAVAESKDTLDALDKGTAAFLEKVPILNNFANFGKSLAIGLGLAVDETKELADAMASLAREQSLFAAAVKGMDQSLANQATLAELQGDSLEANKLKAEAVFQAQMRQAQELRNEAKKFAQEEGTSVNEGRAGVASRQAAELEEQARQIKELTIQAAERAEQEAKAAEEAAKAKEEADEARKIAEEQERIATARVAKETQLKEAIGDIRQTQQDRLQIAELELQIAEATTEKGKEELEQALELVKAEQGLRDASEKVNELFAERVKLAQQAGASQDELTSLERERLNAIDNLQQEFDAKQQRREVMLAQKRKEEAEALEKEKADAAVKAAEEAAKKQEELQKKIRDASKLTFDTSIAGFEATISPLKEMQKGSMPGQIPTQSPKADQTLKVQEDQLENLKDIAKRDESRNQLLDTIRDVLVEIRDKGQSGAFT